MSEDATQPLPGGDSGEILSLLRSIDGRLSAVETRLTALEDKVERRLQDTRPLWEQVLERLTAVEERLTKVEERLTAVEIRLGRVEDEVDSLGRKFREFNRDLLKLQNKHDDLGERLTRMESEQTR
jgi:chromosome segregation ATPase